MEKRRELARLHDEEKEGKRLLAFFEDYNDENDDPKYYKFVFVCLSLVDVSLLGLFLVVNHR